MVKTASNRLKKTKKPNQICPQNYKSNCITKSEKRNRTIHAATGTQGHNVKTDN